jgi:transposase
MEKRTQIVGFVGNGGTHADAALRFKTCTKTVQRYCRMARQGEGLSPKPWPGRKRRFDSERLLRHVRETPDATLAERGEFFGVGYKAIWKRLRQLDVTHKKKTCATPKGTRARGGSSSGGWNPCP